MLVGGGQSNWSSYPWLAFIIGLAIAGLWPEQWPVIYYYGGLAGLACGSSVLSFKRRWLIILCLALGFGRAHLALVTKEAIISQLICSNKVMTMRGEIVGQPQTRSSGGSQLIVKIKSAQCGHEAIHFHGRAMIYGPDNWLDSKVGEEWQFTGKLKTWPAGGVFSYRYSLFSRGVGAIMAGEKRQLVGRRPPNLWLKLVSGQQHLAEVLTTSLPEPAASLAGPLIWGGASRLSAEWRHNLAITGLSHITAVSGFNISLLIILLFNNLLLLRCPRLLASTVTSIVIVVYLALIGCPASAVRAGLLGLLMLWGRQLGRVVQAYHLLLISASLMLIVNPFYLWGDLGFGLSYLAVLGLMTWTNRWDNIIKRLPLVRYPFIRDNLAVTLAAQMWTWPLIFWQFGQISLIAPLANLLVVWALPWLTIFLLLASPIAWLWPAGQVFIFAPAGWLLNVLLMIIKYLAHLPLAGFMVDWPYCWRIIVGIVYYLLTIILLRKFTLTNNDYVVTPKKVV